MNVPCFVYFARELLHCLFFCRIGNFCLPLVCNVFPSEFSRVQRRKKRRRRRREKRVDGHCVSGVTRCNGLRCHEKEKRTERNGNGRGADDSDDEKKSRYKDTTYCFVLIAMVYNCSLTNTFVTERKNSFPSSSLSPSHFSKYLLTVIRLSSAGVAWLVSSFSVPVSTAEQQHSLRRCLHYCAPVCPGDCSSYSNPNSNPSGLRSLWWRTSP